MEAEKKMHFNGDYYHSIDANNRVIMPAKIKDALNGQGFTIYHKPNEKCLRLYLTSEWNDMVLKIAYVDDGVDRTDLQWHFSINSKNCELDAQGRFVIPPKFIEAAGLKKEIVTIGIGPRAEIWDKEAFEEKLSAESDKIVDIVLPF
ncbi:MAG: cell division/cell wall cluster transcriptional repressor MraZ [Clostridia bacterium]|nr:cell division/cell wall cluster transcriptional repressor MraZ [Clostridia bacterium]